MARAIINIKADPVVKTKAQKVAKELGMPLSTIINGYLSQFIRTKEVHFTLEGILKPSVQKRLDRLHQDVRDGKNIVGPFEDAEEAIRYLNS
ncbi:MAG TPA: hypothetical protein VGA53_02485 [Candidatus Paceibacterota bacterium]